MRKIWGSAAVLAATAAMVLVGSGAAMAASPSAVAPMSKHTGTSGCFNWSWADGTITTTVYFHNTCPHKEVIAISWSGGGYATATIQAGAKGHGSGLGHVVAIDDMAILS